MKTLNDTLARIIEIELKQEVNSLYYNDVFLWPIIRSFITRSELKNTLATHKDNAFIRLWILIFDSLTLFNFYKLFKKNIFLLYGYDPSGKYILDKKCIHKQASPIKDYVGKKDFYFLEFGLRNYKTPKIDGVVNISLLFIVFKILSFPLFFFLKIFKKRQMKNEIDKFIVKNNISQEVWNDINDFYQKKSFFNILIRLIKPKRIFLKSFNNTTAFSFIYIANKNNISTIDYQHGQQGDNSLYYSNWHRVPKAGYKMLPRYFWLWDSKSEKKFNSWLPNQTYHKSKVVGNLWFNFVEGNKVLFPPANLKKDNVINVLVCLQITYIPNLIKNAMISGNGIRWYFRLHPREIKNKSKLEKLLNNLGVDFNLFDVEVANTSLIESLLKSVDIVVTEWSTVAYEALLFQKKSIVIHENGLKAFSQLINENKIYYINEPEELLNEIYLK